MFRDAILTVCAAVMVLAIASISRAQEIDAEAVIEGRQSNLRDLGAAFKGVKDELKKSSPNLLLIRQYAAQISDLSKQQQFWFPIGSGPESEVKTKAKADIWARPKEFSRAEEQFSQAAARFLEVAGGNDLAAIKEQHSALGKSCEGCHRVFRERGD